MQLTKSAAGVGLSPATIWRYRKSGRIQVIWVGGKPYITAEAAKRFFTDDGSQPTARVGTGKVPVKVPSTPLASGT